MLPVKNNKYLISALLLRKKLKYTSKRANMNPAESQIDIVDFRAYKI